MILDNPVKTKNTILAINNLTDRNKAIAKWGVAHLEDYKQKFLPERTPKIVKYYALPMDIQRKMNKQPELSLDFWNDEEVKKFFDDTELIVNLNIRNKQWLLWMRKQLQGDEDEGKVNEALMTFSSVVTHIAQPNWQLEIIVK